MSTNRLNVIDVAKGIGMILVIFAHVNYTPELLVLIYSFHMPLFFLISGMMYNKDKYPDFKSFLKRRMKTLIIPYVYFAFFSIVYVFISEKMFPQLFDIPGEKYIRYLTQIVISNWSGTHANEPLWFVLCLFLVEILYYFISKKKVRFIIPVCFLLSCCGWVLESGMLNFDNKLLPWSMDSALFALSFYAIGNLSSGFVKNTIQKIKNHKYGKVICIGLIILFTIAWLPPTLINGKITMGSKILNNGFLLYLNGVLGTIIILLISILLEKSKFLAYCGRNSFVLMASHYMIRRYSLPKYYALLGIELYDKKVFKETIIPFLIVFAMSLLFTYLYEKVNTIIKRKRCA